MSLTTRDFPYIQSPPVQWPPLCCRQFFQPPSFIAAAVAAGVAVVVELTPFLSQPSHIPLQLPPTLPPSSPSALTTSTQPLLVTTAPRVPSSSSPSPPRVPTAARARNSAGARPLHSPPGRVSRNTLVSLVILLLPAPARHLPPRPSPLLSHYRQHPPQSSPTWRSTLLPRPSLCTWTMDTARHATRHEHRSWTSVSSNSLVPQRGRTLVEAKTFGTLGSLYALSRCLVDPSDPSPPGLCFSPRARLCPSLLDRACGGPSPHPLLRGQR